MNQSHNVTERYLVYTSTSEMLELESPVLPKGALTTPQQSPLPAKVREVQTVVVGHFFSLFFDWCVPQGWDQP